MVKPWGSQKNLKIGIVGPCTSGKSTLQKALNERGYQVSHIAQEHSYVSNMWKRLTNPDFLIFLDVSYPITLQRRRLQWKRSEYNEQHRRLKHAREHADLYILTDFYSIEQVLELVLNRLIQ